MMIVMFEVAMTDIGQVMAALAPAMPVVRNFSMESKNKKELPKRPLAKATGKGSGTLRGSKVERLVRAVLATAPRVSIFKIEEHLVANGMAGSSAGPCLSRLSRDKVVSRAPGNMWGLMT